MLESIRSIVERLFEWNENRIIRREVRRRFPNLRNSDPGMNLVHVVRKPGYIRSRKDIIELKVFTGCYPVSVSRDRLGTESAEVSDERV